MFLVFCEEDRSYLILEECKAIFQDDVKKNDKIQFFHCNKMYTGCVIGRSDDENVLTMLRKQVIEKNKETAKTKLTSKPVHGYLPKKTKRQSVASVPYSPPLHINKKKITSSKRQKINNKDNKDKFSDTYNVKTRQLTTALSALSEELSSDDENNADEKKSNKNDNEKENTAVTSHDLVHNKTQHQSAATDSTIVTLLRRIKEMEATNVHLQTLLKEKRALSPSSSSGIDSFTDTTDKENIHAKFINKASVSRGPTRKEILRDITDEESKTTSQKKSKCEDQNIHSNIIQHNSIEVQFKDSENKEELEQKSNDDILEDKEEFLPDVPRKLYQLYGKDFNEDGETMVLLRDGVFCKSSVLHNALGSSTKVTHLVRKLILGVFKEEIFKKGRNQITLTGNSPRFIGKQSEVKYDNIDVSARSAIIKYAKAVGKLKKWPYVHTKDLDRTLSQRIGELKREINK